VLAFMKAFIGTAVLFIPSAVLSRRLGRPVVGYGEIASLAAGHTGKIMVDVATVTSQMGFCCVYFAFIGQNMATIWDLGFSASEAQHIWMLFCVAIFIPLVWVRKLSYFSGSNFVAMLVIFASIILLTGASLYSVAKSGVGPRINWVVGDGFISFFGTSVYAFEGISMVPFVEQEMREKSRFKGVMLGCMAAIVSLLIGIGAVGYLAFGDATNQIILQNLSAVVSEAWWHGAMQSELVLYCLSVVCTFPLMMMPPIHITENLLFPPGSSSEEMTWSKNGWRAATVVICFILASVAASALDHFVSIIGAVCCVPLAFIFPAYFHLQVICVQEGGKHAWSDWAIIAFGFCGGAVALVDSVMSWVNDPTVLV